MSRGQPGAQAVDQQRLVGGPQRAGEVGRSRPSSRSPAGAPGGRRSAPPIPGRNRSGRAGGQVGHRGLVGQQSLGVPGFARAHAAGDQSRRRAVISDDAINEKPGPRSGSAWATWPTGCSAIRGAGTRWPASGRSPRRSETLTYADRRSAGVVHVADPGRRRGGARLGAGTAGRPAIEPLHRSLGTAAATWTVLGGRSLAREAMIISAQLAADDLAAARLRVRNLVGRETAELSADEVARATRGVGGREHLRRRGRAAVLGGGGRRSRPARLPRGEHAGRDGRAPLGRAIGDSAGRPRGWTTSSNWLPARLAAAGHGRRGAARRRVDRETLRIVVRDAGRHPSPNAGVVEAAFAGALGVRLGGRNVYHGEAEDRGVLGDGRPVEDHATSPGPPGWPPWSRPRRWCAGVVLRGWRP